MHCPFCGCEDTRVIDSRLSDIGESVRRRRECQACDARFSTHEELSLNMPLVIKSDGKREKFDREKLRRGMAKSLEKRPIQAEDLDAAVARIMRRFTHGRSTTARSSQSRVAQGDGQEISAQAIGEAIMHELRDLDQVAYVRFASVYRSFQDLEAFDEMVNDLRHSADSASKQ